MTYLHFVFIIVQHFSISHFRSFQKLPYSVFHFYVLSRYEKVLCRMWNWLVCFIWILHHHLDEEKNTKNTKNTSEPNEVDVEREISVVLKYVISCKASKWNSPCRRRKSFFFHFDSSFFDFLFTCDRIDMSLWYIFAQ